MDNYKGVNRNSLIQMLNDKEREVIRMRAQQEETEKKLKAAEEKLHVLLREKEEQVIAIDNAGSIAEAALQLNGVFDAAQKAAGLYLKNIERLNAETTASCEKLMADTQKKCEEMEEAARIRCEEMEEATRMRCEALRRQAEEEAASNWSELSKNLEEVVRSYSRKEEK